MKKFIFGVMLLVSMLGIVGCAMDSSDSGGSDGSENVVYTVKNSTGSEMTISYKDKSDVYVNEKTIPVDGTYEIPASDVKIGTETFNYFGYLIDSPVIYLKIKVDDTEVEGYIQADTKAVIKIIGVERTESGWFNHVECIQNQ